MADHYDALGVSRDASDEEIRAAYKRAARRFHPDREGGDAEKMKAANKARDVLLDPEARTRYDKTGSDDSNGSPESTAADVLGQVVTSVMSRIKPSADLVKAVKAELKKVRTLVDAELKRARLELKRAVKFRGALHKGSDETFAKAVHFTVQTCERNVKTLEGRIAVMDLCDDMVVGYKCVFKEADPELDAAFAEEEEEDDPINKLASILRAARRK